MRVDREAFYWQLQSMEAKCLPGEERQNTESFPHRQPYVLNRSLLSKRLPLLRLLVYLNGNLLVALLNETSAAIGAWKCILQPFYWNNDTDRLGQREVALPIIKNSPRFQYLTFFLFWIIPVTFCQSRTNRQYLVHEQALREAASWAQFCRIRTYKVIFRARIADNFLGWQSNPLVAGKILFMQFMITKRCML